MSWRENPYHNDVFQEYKDAKQTLMEVQWSSTERKNKMFVCCISFCLLVAVFCFLSAFLSYFLIGITVQTFVNDNAVVSSENSPGYPLWLSNIDNLAPPEYECYNFFNLTNYLDVANNNTAVPNYEEKGPYCYRLNHEKINVEWSDDGNEVTYNLFQNYVWAPDQSVGDALTDKVVNISPGYIGILATTGTEEDLTIAFSGPAFQTNMKWLTTEFVHHIETKQQHSALGDSYDAITSQNVTEQEFYSIWANSTQESGAEWVGMLVSYAGTSSSISIDSASLLWNSRVSNSLLDRSNGAESLWFNATLLDNETFGGERWSQENDIRNDAQLQLQSQFNLTSSQMKMIAGWLRESYFPQILDPSLLATYQAVDSGVQEITDLGWLQWAQCGVSSKSASKEYYFKAGGVIDYGCFVSKRIEPLSIAQAKQLLNGTQGLFHMVFIGYFFDAYGEALNPLSCPGNTTTEFNFGCESCNGCTEAMCEAKRNGSNCTLHSDGLLSRCMDQNNSTRHCRKTHVSCSLPVNTVAECETCIGCANSTLPVNGTYLSPGSSCSQCLDCKMNNTKTSCNRCETCDTCSAALNCYNEEKWDYMTEIWGLQYEETIKVAGYILYASEAYGNPYLEKVLFGGGGGMFPIRTVNEWIFDQKDPLMFLANPIQPNAGNLIQNMTTQADALNYKNITVYTGKDDITQTAVYKAYGGVETIPTPFWAEPVPLSGCTEWGQFQPFLNERDATDLYTWDSTYFRELHLERMGSVKYRDVPLWRFMLSNDTFHPNPTYYQTIPGFANTTSFHQSCPIFYSNPHFSGVGDEYANKVKGVKENRNWKTDNTIVDVDPITGMVFHVNETVQVNLFLDATYHHFNREHTRYYQPPLDIFYPIMIAYKETSLSKQNAAEYQIGLVWSQWLQNFSFAFWFASTFVCIICAFTLTIKLIRSIRKSESEGDGAVDFVEQNEEASPLIQ